MTQALPKLVNFEEFVEWLPENSAVRYELHNGDIIQIIQPILRTVFKQPEYHKTRLKED